MAESFGRGIIPARAGFTSPLALFYRGGADHPRTRGVYRDIVGDLAGMAGSSPHARGLPATVISVTATRRIIPARAGFTLASGSPPAGPRDHPRTRGVYRVRELGDASVPGSSPHARGLLRLDVVIVAKARIIPARAGFTWSVRIMALRLRDHPRTRGVYVSADVASRDADGSSPHARGLHEHVSYVFDRKRIIPARAGFTGCGARPGSRSGDHPRTRGVYGAWLGADPDADGSSPHARGLLLRLSGA